MKFLLNILVTAMAVLILAYFLPGVNVTDYISAIIVAIVLGLLKLFVKPILVIFTLPVTIFTLGLFLLVINAVIISMADYFVGGFAVQHFGWAFIFSILLSFTQSILHKILGTNDEKEH